MAIITLNPERKEEEEKINISSGIGSGEEWGRVGESGRGWEGVGGVRTRVQSISLVMTFALLLLRSLQFETSHPCKK